MQNLQSLKFQGLNFLVIIILVNLNLINNSWALEQSSVDTGGASGAGFAGVSVFTPTAWGCQFKADASPRATVGAGASDAVRLDSCIVEFGSDHEVNGATGSSEFVVASGRVVGLSAALAHTEHKPMPVTSITRHRRTHSGIAVRPLGTVTETEVGITGAGIEPEVSLRTRFRSDSSETDPIITIAKTLERSSGYLAEQVELHKLEMAEQKRQQALDADLRAAELAAEKIAAARAARCNNITTGVGILTSVGAVVISGVALYYQAHPA